MLSLEHEETGGLPCSSVSIVMFWVLFIFIRSELDPAIFPVISKLLRWPVPLVLPRRVDLVSIAPCILETEEKLLFFPGSTIVNLDVL